MIDLNEIQTIEHDVLVVGAGGAGLRATILQTAVAASVAIHDAP